ncbi:hypothetical protein ElyMa_002700600 [Elysia marginata]|uniref:Uncharacterized protein n=1 Tax=Elysia marginata TaxID=1093978 RepID=A0AAV4HE47_9GAST|nr:hypothetical protein ElyMa_002700600 [Elysia marginata]
MLMMLTKRLSILLTDTEGARPGRSADNTTLDEGILRTLKSCCIAIFLFPLTILATVALTTLATVASTAGSMTQLLPCVRTSRSVTLPITEALSGFQF